MPTYRYEAVDPSGVPVHGTQQAADEEGLANWLSQRQLWLVNARELSKEAVTGNQPSTLPRLYQLRVGEQLREALLTGLPAPEAVRAIAAEPLSHPLLAVAPWMQGLSLVLFVAVVSRWMIVGGSRSAVIGTGGLALVVVPLIWVLLREIYQQRPRRFLRKLANRLERGESLSQGLTMAVPNEMKAVMKSNVSETQKANVAADLAPSLLGGNLRTQQFVMGIVGPLVLFGIMLFLVYSSLLFVVPQFGDIFDGFGVELPPMTSLVVGWSRFVESFGIVGWLSFAGFGCLSLIVIAVGLTNARVNEFLSRVPLFGLSFRWAMQARVARTLAAMLRNECSFEESLRAATASSGFKSVTSLGETMATQLENGSTASPSTRWLSGLPMSMLLVQNSTLAHEDRRSGMAATFQSLSEMLEAAASHQGRLFSIIVRFFTITMGVLFVVLTLSVLFMPLLKLLNDIS